MILIIIISNYKNILNYKASKNQIVRFSTGNCIVSEKQWCSGVVYKKIGYKLIGSNAAIWLAIDLFVY